MYKENKYFNKKNYKNGNLRTDFTTKISYPCKALVEAVGIG